MSFRKTSQDVVLYKLMENLGEDTFCLPGEVLGTVYELKVKYKMKDFCLGPGLRIDGEKFIPCENDFVIGKVVRARGDHYKVDLGSGVIARLPILSFTNATKKVRPELKVGDLVYSRIILVDSNIESELSCVGQDHKKCVFGLLSSSNASITTISMSLAHRLSVLIQNRLLSKNNQLIHALGSDLPEKCEIVVGINGVVYVSSSFLETSLKLVEAFKQIDNVPTLSYNFRF